MTNLNDNPTNNTMRKLRLGTDFAIYREYHTIEIIWKPSKSACYVYYDAGKGARYRVNIYNDVVEMLGGERPGWMLRRRITRTRPETLHISSRPVNRDVHLSHVAPEDIREWIDRAIL